MKKFVTFLIAAIFIAINGQAPPENQKILDLSTGKYDDGTVMPIEIDDPDWSYIIPDGTRKNVMTRHTYSGWYVPTLGDGSMNERWITWQNSDNSSPDGYYEYFSKSFTIPVNAEGYLELRSLSFVRNWTYLVKENLDGTIAETLITQTTWMNDGAKGWFNSRSPLVEQKIFPGTYHIKVKVYSNNGSVRQSLNVNARIKYTEKNEDYTRSPNSYIFDIDAARKNNYGGLLIPVKKAYAVWANSEGYLNESIPSGKQSASLHWEDVPGIISSTDIKGSGEEAQIQVVIDKSKGKGNAVVAFHVGPNGNSSDPIYWSWHVWVTDDPTNGVQFGHIDKETQLSMEKDVDGNTFVPKFMDRNLGALSSNFLGHGWTKTGGLMYQWGRKDPLPPLADKDGNLYVVTGSVDSKPVTYDEYYDRHTIFRNSISSYTYPEDIKYNIAYSIHHPFTHINNDGYQSSLYWFTTARFITESPRKNFDLWGDSGKGELYGERYQLKSAYDPCPDGWRVPSFASQNNFVVTASPWGRQRGKGVNQNPAGDGISFQGDEFLYGGIKIYPGLGFDFTGVSDQAIGKIALTGKFNKGANGKELAKFQDNNSESFVLSATLGGNSLMRIMHLVNDPAMPMIGKEAIKGKININSHGSNFDAAAVQCIQDPNHSKLANFSTQYINDLGVDYRAGINNANTLIVKPGETQKEIPINKAYAMYNQYLTNHEWPQGKQSVNVYWTTNKQLIKQVSLEGSGENAKIQVNITPGQLGNAIVSLHMGSKGNSSDPVIWSWQVWVPNGDPEKETYTYVTENVISGVTPQIINPTKWGLPPLTTEFMDRNLGAIESYPIGLKSDPTNSNLIFQAMMSGGMHYQWGRKDPIPTFGADQATIYLGSTISGSLQYTTSISGNIYDANYTQPYSYYNTVAGVSSEDKRHEKIAKILKYSANYPLNYLYNTGTSVDWISDEDAWIDNRWGHGEGKSPFDPCPEGWRVPDFSFISHLDGIKNNPRGFSPWYNGYYDNGNGLAQNWGGLSSGYGATQIQHNSKWGIVFDGIDYKIGGYLMTGIRGAYRNVPKTIYNSNGLFGLWSSTMYKIGLYYQGENSRGRSFSAQGAFGSQGSWVSFSSSQLALTYSAMNVRCAKDVPRYDGTVGQRKYPSTKKSFVIVEDKIQEELSESQIQIYPNPNSGIFTIKFDTILDAAIQIVNINGGVTFSKNIKGESELAVNIQNQPSGVYMIKVQSGQKTVTKKIIKN